MVNPTSAYFIFFRVIMISYYIHWNNSARTTLNSNRTKLKVILRESSRSAWSHVGADYTSE